MSRNRKISRTINAEPEAFELARSTLRQKIMDCEKQFERSETDTGKRQWADIAAKLRLILAQLN